MADLNALIAQGYQPQAPVDPFAQYAKMQQLNVGQNQNALAQYQLAQAQRADVQANALNAAYANATDPATGKIDYGKVTSALANANAGGQIPAVLKNQFETQKLQTEAQLKSQELVDAKLKQSRGLLDNINLADPNAPQQYLAWHQANHADPILGPMLTARGVTEDSARANINAAIAQGPQAFANLVNQSKLGVEKFAELNKLHFVQENLNNASKVTAYPGLGGEGTVLSNTPTAMNAFETARIPILQQQANAATLQANTGRAHLGLSAITADPFNLTGAQTAFPLGMGGGVGVSAGGVTGARPAVTPTGVPAGTGTPPKGESTIIGTKPVPLSVAINQGVKGTDLLAAMPAPLAAQIAAITDHRAAPPSRNTARADQLMQLVNLVDPTYDATSYKTKQGIETAFTSGRPGTLLKSLNVVQDHLGTFADTAKELGNSELPFVNAIGNKISQWTGQPAPTNFAAVKTVVADELTKAILGTAGALGDRNAMKEEINAASSPAMLAGVIGKWQKLIAGQVNGLSDQYKSGGGSNPAVLNLFGKAKTSAAPAAAGGEHPADIQAIIDAQKRK